MQAPGRIIFHELPDKLEITIPTKKNRVTLVVFLVMIAFWLITGGLSSLLALPAKKEVDYSDWVWALWGIALILLTLRNLWLMAAQKEVIAFNRGLISIKKQGNIFSGPKKYDLSKARYFRVEEDDDNDSLFDGRPAAVIGTGLICFDYDRKTIRFAEAVTEAEAEIILLKLKNKAILTGKNL